MTEDPTESFDEQFCSADLLMVYRRNSHHVDNIWPSQWLVVAVVNSQSKSNSAASHVLGLAPEPE
ncbi:MAG TPA: hypothetical protein V6C95_18355 [Coleofasciculaceae cyanobacterium]